MDFARFGAHDYDKALDLARDLFSKPERPSAVFAMSDMQALACIAAAKEAGLRVPEDVSVIGYDDLEIAYHTGLTTLRQHLELNGSIALKCLVDQIRGDPCNPDPLPAPVVIERLTTRRFEG